MLSLHFQTYKAPSLHTGLLYCVCQGYRGLEMGQQLLMFKTCDNECNHCLVTTTITEIMIPSSGQL